MQINLKVNSFELEIWDNEASLCTFYTVRDEGAALNETDKFFEKHHAIEEYEEPTSMLLNFLLKTIGEDHGAQEYFFNRHENEVKGLPFQGKISLHDFCYYFPRFPLRLYAVRLRENIVILFNGGIKDGATNQTSRLHPQWIAACQYAQRIDQALIQKEIYIDEQSWEIKNSDQSNTIIL